MNDPSIHKTAPHTSSAKGECCTELKCESGLRNNYFDGKRLTTDSFRVEQTYSLERRHLLNRAIHGWGVVYGYEVASAESHYQKDESGQIEIGAGLALDKCGRELVENGTSLQFKDVTFLDREGKRGGLEDLSKRLGIPSDFSWDAPPQGLSDALKEACWLLSVHYAERDTAHVRIEDRCSCGHDEWDHLCETVRYSVRPIDCGECCNHFDCELECECRTGPCCDEPKTYIEQEKSTAEDRLQPRRGSRQRGGCQCLCQHLTHLEVGGECGPLCEIEEPCGNVRVDLKNGVPLACVRLVTDKCGLAFGTIEEACGPRRLVKRNDLLFDLIRGCDLTRIEKIGWEGLLGGPSFDDFAKYFKPASEDKNVPVKTDFWVEFSRSVRKETLRPECFVMTVIYAEYDDDWWQTARVPIVAVAWDSKDPGGDPNLVDRAGIIVDGPWFWDTVKGATSAFRMPTRIELEVRGDLIVDCNGQTVDANSFGHSAVPSGNGTPGGTFLSTFLVGPAPTPSRPAAYNSEDRIKGVL